MIHTHAVFKGMKSFDFQPHKRKSLRTSRRREGIKAGSPSGPAALLLPIRRGHCPEPAAGRGLGRAQAAQESAAAGAVTQRGPFLTVANSPQDQAAAGRVARSG